VTQQSRMLLLMVIVAIGSVVALMLLAQRYNSILEKRAVTEESSVEGQPVPDIATDSFELGVTEIVRTIDDFIQVRQILGALIEGEATGETQQENTDVKERLEASLKAALGQQGMGEADYRQLSLFYRQWKAGSTALSPILLEAFERRREELAEIDLGEYESHGL
jgi:hypothetical protein